MTTRDIMNQVARDMYDHLMTLFQEHPGKKLVFTGEVGYRKITEISPFGTLIISEKNENGEWTRKDTGEGAGHLLAKEHYIHGERWCSKALESYCDTIEELSGILRIIRISEERANRGVNIHEAVKKNPDRIYCIWEDNDQENENWVIGF